MFYIAFSICMLILFTGSCMTFGASNYFVEAEAAKVAKETGVNTSLAAAFARFFLYAYYFTSVVCVLLVSMWVLGQVGNAILPGATP